LIKRKNKKLSGNLWKDTTAFFFWELKRYYYNSKKKVTTSQNENRERRLGGEGAVAGPEGGTGGNGPGWVVLRSRNRLNAVR
jgi:hypothetical protein